MEFQNKQKEWHMQWSLLQDDELFLLQEWIYPTKIEDFQDKEVLECGCGGGQHTSYISPFASNYYAVDLNTIDIAKKKNENKKNIEFIEADIAKMNLNKKFDFVISIGVIHHTDNPDLTFENLKNHTKKDGKTIVWVYSKEGNWLVENIVEPIRKHTLIKISRKSLLIISKTITAIMYIPIFSIYLLPLKFLPFYEYFQNFRILSYKRNTLNVFDKLNAPQVDFISRERIEKWFNKNDYSQVHISSYKNVSWRGSGIKKI